MLSGVATAAGNAPGARQGRGRTQKKEAVTPQETDPDLPVSVQESPVEAWVNSLASFILRNRKAGLVWVSAFPNSSALWTVYNGSFS